jgi:hypothetical protein
VVVCKGYGEDWKLYTGLDWGEDKDNDFREYKDFRVWVSIYSFLELEIKHEKDYYKYK